MIQSDRESPFSCLFSSSTAYQLKQPKSQKKTVLKGFLPPFLCVVYDFPAPEIDNSCCQVSSCIPHAVPEIYHCLCTDLIHEVRNFKKD